MQNKMKGACTRFLVSLFMGLWVTVSLNAQASLEPGDYFITNVDSGRALTPVGNGPNSNARLRPFTKSGMQKWTVKKNITRAKDGKVTLSYTIQHASSGLYLRPYHVPDNGNAIISGSGPYGNFTLERDGGGFIIKNIGMGGDAMYSKNLGFEDDEPWFGPDAAMGTYRWQFVPME